VPEHVTVHIESDAVIATEKESFVGQDRFIADGNGSGVYGFWVGTCGILLNNSGGFK